MKTIECTIVDTNIKNLLIIFMVLVSAAGLLLISMSRATLEIMSKDEMEGKLRIEPVIIDGITIYKLPQTNMLPDNMFYGFKEMRDWLWLKFSFGGEKKVKTVLILADKGIAESKALAKKGNYDLALETGMKAVDKLKYANDLVSELKKQNSIQDQLVIQIRDATTAYSEIIKEIGRSVEKDNQKYLLLQQNIDDFRKEQTQKETAR